LGADVLVVRNDAVGVSEITDMDPQAIVISPGPCTPNEAGISLEVIHAFAGKIPMLGICLGHQSIGQAYGGDIVRADKVMHGKLSKIYHNGEGVFAGLANPFTATRYHSLVIDKNSCPDCFEISAWTENENKEVEEIMGVRHRKNLVEGVQFHPESISSEYGFELLQNFLDYGS
jgi:anthranilate synthase component 2